MLRVLIFLILAFLSFISNPKFASAHPIDEIGDVNVYDQKQILTISKDRVILAIDLSFYALEKIKVWESIDTNRDKTLTQEEKDTWMRKGQESSWLEVYGQKYNFEATSLVFPDYYNFFSTPPANVIIEFTLNYSVAPNSQITYHYQGKDKALSEIEFIARGVDRLKVENTTLLNDESVSLLVEEGLQEEGLVLGLKTGDRLNSFLNRYVKTQSLSITLIILALATSYVIGALHALTPGHGKALVAGYLVGERATIWHAVQLGGIITLTHTGSVFLLGGAALLLTQYIVPATIIRYLNLTSGILIVAFGLFLLYRRTKHLLVSKNHLHPHHHHDHDDLKPLTQPSWKNLIPLGISGGIVPCVDALAILIVAVSLQKILLGLILLVTFSLGLASALILGGILVVVAKNKAVKRLNSFEKYEHYLSIFSALIVTLLGLGIILKV